MTDWTTPGAMTDPGKCAHLFDDLPTDVPGLFRTGHGGSPPTAAGSPSWRWRWCASAGSRPGPAAALLNLETLPWDTWDGMPSPDSPFDPSLFDQLAEATAVPDLPAVRRLLPLPEKVRNEQRDRDEVLR